MLYYALGLLVQEVHDHIVYGEFIFVVFHLVDLLLQFILRENFECLRLLVVRSSYICDPIIEFFMESVETVYF